MERTHPRDMQSMAVRAAIKKTRDAAAAMHTTAASSRSTHSLLTRGVRIARSLLTTRCVQTESLNTCEKPAASSGTVLGIIIASGIVGFFLVLAILYWLHRRGKKRDANEFANDPHELSDYGLDDAPVTKKGGKRGDGLSAPDLQQHRLSAQQLMEAQNPFGTGAELADSDRVESKGSPPRYPGDAHVKA
ncbi:hypothetical protein M406DRAFT_357287 [Cryphonectria parasitica EP155]|uniref:Uncharacterized protein n=1 Tax=Cryphonectria parasitica (strain ATCC 38755 / EP155) TaxID=660469 RepID=A0A9P4XZJ8_CRYP1|nr:uncharacterized protein M406DRAFT_357287 [Cryphonectria parasitica EP155]KAF3763903.1 hypothetical protein M406DRAFT_357287 [Cryphonectria parasitica EP155]